MFRRLDNKTPDLLEFELDGNPVSAPTGLSVAAALLYLEIFPLRRNPIDASPRMPLCMMGACSECLIEIDGRRNCRACQVELRAGMRLQRQLSVDW